MQTKTGGCHCGTVRYEADVDLESAVISCNCSHCQIKGLLLSFIPEEHMRVTEGEDALEEYRFNTKKIQHLFCPTCGVEAFGKGVNPDGSPAYAINVRSIDDIDPSVLTIEQYNGKDF